MRLTEFDPRWIGIDRRRASEAGAPYGEDGPGIRFGLSFLCPHCRETRLAVLFKPFIDPDNLARLIEWAIPGAPDPNTGEIKEPHWWQRAGENFDDMTLSPSIDASATGHWHGFIINGGLV